MFTDLHTIVSMARVLIHHSSFPHTSLLFHTLTLYNACTWPALWFVITDREHTRTVRTLNVARMTASVSVMVIGMKFPNEMIRIDAEVVMAKMRRLILTRSRVDSCCEQLNLHELEGLFAEHAFVFSVQHQTSRPFLSIRISEGGSTFLTSIRYPTPIRLDNTSNLIQLLLEESQLSTRQRSHAMSIVHSTNHVHRLLVSLVLVAWVDMG